MTEGGKRHHDGFSGAPRASAFAPLKTLLRPHEQDAATGLRNLSSGLKSFGSRVRIHVQLVDGDQTDHWTIESGKGKPSVQKTAPKKAEMVVVMRPETWIAIAQGRLSPFDALFSGKLRFGGDGTLGKEVVRHLSDASVPFQPPC
jgi:hypothetical protein